MYGTYLQNTNLYIEGEDVKYNKTAKCAGRISTQVYATIHPSDCSIGLLPPGPGRIIFFFTVEPCSLKVSVWWGRMFWIPKADITTLAARIGLWHEGTKVLKWKTILCHGVDDDYSFCGTLKGETINTTVRISGAQPTYLQGEYTAVFEAFSGHFEELVACMNYTLIIKQKLH